VPSRDSLLPTIHPTPTQHHSSLSNIALININSNSDSIAIKCRSHQVQLLPSLSFQQYSNNPTISTTLTRSRHHVVHKLAASLAHRAARKFRLLSTSSDHMLIVCCRSSLSSPSLAPHQTSLNPPSPLSHFNHTSRPHQQSSGGCIPPPSSSTQPATSPTLIGGKSVEPRCTLSLSASGFYSYSV
jgi:hypothetical protein